jgi:hypothetical protein
MTRLSKTVRRMVDTARHGTLAVALAPEGIWLREKGRRYAVLMPYGMAYQIAAEMEVRSRSKKRRAR